MEQLLICWTTTDVYSHIIDEDRRKNAFYKKENLNPQLHEAHVSNTMQVPDGVDPELLMKILSNPELAALLTSLAKSMQ